MLKNKIFWICIFGFIMMSMWAYLFFAPLKGVGVFGFPRWIYGFLLISAVYSFSFYIFSKHFWKEARD